MNKIKPKLFVTFLLGIILFSFAIVAYCEKVYYIDCKTGGCTANVQSKSVHEVRAYGCNCLLKDEAVFKCSYCKAEFTHTYHHIVDHEIANPTVFYEPCSICGDSNKIKTSVYQCSEGVSWQKTSIIPHDCHDLDRRLK